MSRRLISYAKRHPKLSILAAYLLLVAAVTAVLVWRYPNNVFYPNFYAEDGSVFLQNILDKGWLGASFTSFNGYFITGIYMLCGFGWLLNEVFGGAGLLSLPAYFALAAIIFMAAVICLPFPLLRRTLGSKKMLLVIAFSALLPLPQSPHIVIGTIGNQKFMFMYLAFLLGLYRLFRGGKLSLRVLVAIDIGFLIAAYTNTTVYLLFPVLFLPYLKHVWGGRKKPGWLAAARSQLKLREVQSLLVLGVALLPQVIFVALHGIPKMAGYLDTPFRYGRTIEIFIDRTYLFGVTHIINGYMGDALAVILFAMLLAVGIVFVKDRKERLAFWFGIYAAGVSSLLFVVNRPGVSDFFMGYQPAGSGPDQFFYAQTLIMYLPIVIAASAVARRLPRRWMGIAALVLFSGLVLAAGLISNVRYDARWRNASIFENAAGTFTDQAVLVCSKDTGQTVRVALYPYPDGRFSLTVPRDQVCGPKLQDYQLSYWPLGLEPDNNDFLKIERPGDFYQTFEAGENGLDGIRLFVSNFDNSFRSGTYTLELYDKSCHRLLRQSPIPPALIDNSFYNARFSPLADSQFKTYCFSLRPPAAGTFDPIAIQRSQSGIYPNGTLTVRGATSDTDAVFVPLYTQAGHAY